MDYQNMPVFKRLMFLTWTSPYLRMREPCEIDINESPLKIFPYEYTDILLIHEDICYFRVNLYFDQIKCAFLFLILSVKLGAKLVTIFA